MKMLHCRRCFVLLLVLCLLICSLPAAQAVYSTNGEKIVYGYSGEGRELCAYRYGIGKNVFVIGFALHGYEDHFKQDGKALVYTAEQLMASLAKSGLAQQRGWSVYVLPCINPDGLESGYTEDGPGRCTTMRYDQKGNLVKGGIDLNRCFPTNFTAEYTSRNYTGPTPMAAKEAQALSSFLQSVKGSGTNLLVDTHGWYQQTIVFSKSSPLYTAFHQYFPNNTDTVTSNPSGYLINYARTLGYDSCLFEMPRDIYSMKDYYNSGYCEKYISSIEAVLKTKSVVCPDGHNYQTTRQEPTCTAAGSQTMLCTRCGDTVTASLPALGHIADKNSIVAVQKATATQNGQATYTCSRCHKAGLRMTLNRVFSDTKSTAFYCNAVDYAYSAGLIQGTSATTFSPNDALSRAMLVTILYRIAGSPAVERTHHFVDVSETAYYANAVAWAYQSGIVEGKTEDSFAPSVPVNRQQAAVLLHRYVSTFFGDSGLRSDLSGFRDRNKISDYAVNAMAWCVGSGILQGVSSDTLSPTGTTTRAQGMVMLYRVLEYLAIV